MGKEVREVENKVEVKLESSKALNIKTLHGEEHKCNCVTICANCKCGHHKE